MSATVHIGPSLSPRDLSLPRFAVRRGEAAASLGVSETKFEEWVKDGRMPKPIKIDGVVLWCVQDIREAWERMKDGDRAKNPFDEVVA
jgi:predicted DNA-binding transcriptional regulator AlpA